MKQETNNEIDLLLRRLSRRDAASAPHADGEHLDADELSSYTENALPAVARARYTEHLAECASCRKLVAQLSSAVGLVNEFSKVSEQSGFRKFLASLFSPIVLRYAVPALGLIVVAAIGFTVLRRQERQSADSVAQLKEQDSRVATSTVEQSPQPSSGLVTLDDKTKSAATSTPQPHANKPSEVPAPPPNAPPSVTVQTEVKQDAPKAAQQPEPTAPAPPAATPAPQPSATAAATVGGVQTVEAERKAQDRIATASGVASAPESRKALRERSLELAKLKRSDSAEKDKNEAAETRSVGGRRFRKENGVWIDTAYDSSRATVNLTRGSEQYRALVADEPTIKTIAEQLDGEIVVVWKGHAYRIR